MTTTGDQVLLNETLKQLRLPTMRREYVECARQAKEAGDDYPTYLLILATRELENRRANQLRRRLKEARFPIMKTLEITDLDAVTKKRTQLLASLPMGAARDVLRCPPRCVRFL